jgi:hypothetical protein
MEINEIFSMFLERITRNKKYLKKIKILNRGELEKKLKNHTEKIGGNQKKPENI